jgi:uncharacterized membrane protein (UPF0127 family)
MRVRIWMEPADSARQLIATAETADTPATRTRGLLGRDSLAPGDGLILEPCRLIHTFFMRFSIDVLFIDRHFRVTRVAHDVRPFRFAWGGWAARTTLELPAGTVAALPAPLTRGMQLRFEPVP